MPDSGGVYFVPAFGGLLAPWWQDDARGAILGLTGYTTRVGDARQLDIFEAAPCTVSSCGCLLTRPEHAHQG